MISFQNGEFKEHNNFGKNTANHTVSNNSHNFLDEISDEQLAILKACTVFLEEKEKQRFSCMLQIFELRRTFFKMKNQNGNSYDKSMHSRKEPNMEQFFEILKKELPPGKDDFIKQYEEMMETMAFYQELMLMKRE